MLQESAERNMFAVMAQAESGFVKYSVMVSQPLEQEMETEGVRMRVKLWEWEEERGGG